MNKKVVYIFWCERLNEFRGGVHRVILLLLKHLPARGFDVHYLYTLDSYKSFKLYNSDIEAEEEILVENLRDYLVSHNCNIILGQDAAYSKTLTTLVKEMNLPGVKLINEYHASFLLLPSKLNMNYLKYEFLHGHSLLIRMSMVLRFLCYPLWKKRMWEILKKDFRYTLSNSDINLLLSKHEIPTAKSILGEKSNNPIVAIPNPLSWEDTFNEDILAEKRKEVLIVSRIYNPEKRIDIALKVWKKLQDRGLTNDWHLRIIGDGLHKEYLMKMSEDMKLRNVDWMGWRDPKPYYKTSSIFMMTSGSEGWGMTLTECMQTATVPVALDTYPALHDIITDGYDGFIVEKSSIRKYADRMQLLMQDKELREQIAKNALISCQRFSTEKIMDMWSDMLHSL